MSTHNQLRGFPLRYWIFHYTYQFEYMLDGTPCQPWTIGEYSLDKRHFSSEYPTYPLPEPPPKANAAAFYLLRTFNEAMGNLSSAWPARQPAAESGRRPVQTLYGRRRLDWFSRHANGFATEMRTMPLVKKLAGTQWTCKGGTTLTLDGSGNVQGLGRGSGRWGTMNDPTLGERCPVYSCIFLDFGGGFGGGAHDARFDPNVQPPRLTVMSHQSLEEKHTCAMQM